MAVTVAEIRTYDDDRTICTMRTNVVLVNIHNDVVQENSNMKIWKKEIARELLSRWSRELSTPRSVFVID